MALAKQPPNELPHPDEDGLFVPDADLVRRSVTRRFGAIADLAATESRVPRACVIIGDDYGYERDSRTGQLCWSPALLAAQTRTEHNRIVVCASTAQSATTLAARAARILSPRDAVVVDVNDRERLTELRSVQAKPRFVVVTGWAAETPVVVKSLLPGFAPQRALTVLADAPVPLELIGMVALHESADVIATTTVGRCEETADYLRGVLGLRIADKSRLPALLSSALVFASSTVTTLDEWMRLLRADEPPPDEFFLTLVD
jgi:hypothetical protein